MSKPLPDRVRVLACVLTYDGRMGADLMAYLCGLSAKLLEHPRLAELRVTFTRGYPTDRCRNAAVKGARDEGYDFLAFFDDDMRPDLLVGRDPAAKPFLPSALDFALAQPAPCVVGAPYCGAPPKQRVMVMRYRQDVPDVPDGAGLKIDSFTREEAAERSGFEKVAALPTGCLLIDLRALDELPPPWFSYEYDDPPFNTKLASTEDIVFTRNLAWLGVPQWVAWDSWAGHNKFWLTGKPQLSPVDDLPDSIFKAWAAGWRPKPTTD